MQSEIAIIVICRCTSPSHSGGGSWAGMRRNSSLRTLPAPFIRHGDTSRIVNLGRPLACWSAAFLRALVQPRKQPSRCFTDGFELSWFASAHEATKPQRTSHDHGKVIHEYGKANV